jgi:hypothetical protein
LFYLEVFNVDSVEDFSLLQWLTLMLADLVAQVLNVGIEVVEEFGKEK